MVNRFYSKGYHSGQKLFASLLKEKILSFKGSPLLEGICLPGKQSL